MSVVPDGVGHDGRPDDARDRGPILSRRAVLQAGLIGAVAVASGGVLRSRAAEAAGAENVLTPGIYDLNQDWLFGGVYVGGSEAPGYPETGFTEVTLPHTVTPLSWGDWDHTTWEEVWVYRRHIGQPAGAVGRVFVDFDGVMTTATVYLGGTQIARHQGGYLPWSVELTPDLAAGDNVLAVVVDATWQDVPPDGAAGGAGAVDYFQPGGIYRDVTLRVVPDVFIFDVFAMPTDVLTAPAVEVQFTIDAAAVPIAPVTLTAEVMDGTTVLGSVSGTVSITEAGEMVTTLSVSELAGVSLWSPDNPRLYQVTAGLVADGVPHAVTVTIGFREATFELDGFYLNGQRLEIFGLNRHQLFPYTGMAACRRLQRRDAELLKSVLNCNMVRCSHYPQSPHFLDACDELGLMIWEEPPGWQYVGDAAFQALVLADVHDMVVRDRNRPSVIVWATRLNETANYPDLYAQARQLAYTLDGSRQTTGAVDFQSTTSGWAEDVYAYDDYHSSGGNAVLEPPLTNVPYMISEAVGALDGAPLYRWVDTEQTLQLQAQMHAQVHSIAQSDPAYAGLLGWAGIDYASLSGGDRIWHNVKWPGVLDTFRVPKPGAGFYRSQVDPTVAPVILPMFFWDFGSGSPPNGPGAATMIATNCDSLDIYVAGAIFTTATPDATGYPGLAHPPVLVNLTVARTGLPDLRIDGYVAGDVVASVQMSCDPSRDTLVLTIEDASINGDGTDATRFTVRALDAYGNQRPYPTGDVTLSLSGPATLVAENPFPFALYGGVGGGFIQSQPGTSGAVTLIATHPTLGQATGQMTIAPSAPAAPTSTALGPSPASPLPASAPPTVTPPSSPPPALTVVVTPAEVRRALAAVLRPSRSQRRISELLRHHGYSFAFDSPSAGTLVVDWNYDPAKPDHHKPSAPQQELVAAAKARIRKAGATEIKLRLTPRGRSLLRHAAHERLTITAGFTPVGESATKSSRVVTVTR
ncbi:MAG: glycoside hydrolase family 2 TIM barrel-domain containing protein [Solirubrobacteraceae bacterium]